MAGRSLGLGHTPCWTARQPPTRGVWWCLVANHIQLCNPMDGSPPGFPVLHHLAELAQTHVHRVSDAIQPAHPLLLLLLPPSVFPSIRVFSDEWPWRVGPDTEMDSGASMHLRSLDAGCLAEVVMLGDSVWLHGPLWVPTLWTGLGGNLLGGQWLLLFLRWLTVAGALVKGNQIWKGDYESSFFSSVHVLGIF